MVYAKELINKLQKKEARVAVLGLGYVGLPLAVVFAESGFKVTGIDPIREKVDTLNQGRSYILDISDAKIKSLLDSGSFSATVDFSALNEVDAVSICVPTPLRKTGDPDLSYILSVADSLQK
jgi:UDP-N-acetyl-D-glucosamine dehydrogenase